MNVQNIMAYSNAIFKFWGRAYFLLFKYNAGLPFHYRILGIRILPSFSFITMCGVCVCVVGGGNLLPRKDLEVRKIIIIIITSNLLFEICFYYNSAQQVFIICKVLC